MRTNIEDKIHDIWYDYNSRVKRGKYELHIYWDDGVTIECRYFNTKKAAMEYVKNNGIINYLID